MKRSFLALTIISIIAFSCNNNSKQPEQTVTNKDSSKAVENKIQIPVTTCYSNISNKDTVTMKLEVFDRIVTGNLVYQYHEKDSNKGEFEGKLKGDTLFADYKFLSEGIQSTREVIFLIKDSIAIEGYGNMEEKNGKMIFKDAASVSFAGIKLKKEDCNY